MSIKKILLYNCFHIGDILFSQFIVRGLCVNNPQIRFILSIKNCTFLFSGTPNLEVCLLHEHTILEEKHTSTPYFLYNDETLAINLWIYAIALNNWGLCDHIEVSLPNTQKQFSIIVGLINNQFDLQLKFPFYNTPYLLPVLPAHTDISGFLNWSRNSKYTRKILYFNYLPKSGQKVPVHNHDNVILQLSYLFPDSAVIVPKLSTFLLEQKNDNIINAEEILDCKQIEPGCEHLCKLGKISLLCSYAVVFDIGACYFYINNGFITSNVSIIHASPHNRFFQKVRSHWDNLPEHRMRFLHSNNEQELLHGLQKLIS